MTESQEIIDNLREGIAAAEKILALLEKQQKEAKTPPHVWEHGDVFRNISGTYIYLCPQSGDVTINIFYADSGGTPGVQLFHGSGVEFLFNIKEKIQ